MNKYDVIRPQESVFGVKISEKSMDHDAYRPWTSIFTIFLYFFIFFAQLITKINELWNYIWLTLTFLSHRLNGIIWDPKSTSLRAGIEHNNTKIQQNTAILPFFTFLADFEPNRFLMSSYILIWGYVCLSVCLSIHPSDNLSIHPSVCPSICHLVHPQLIKIQENWWFNGNESKCVKKRFCNLWRREQTPRENHAEGKTMQKEKLCRRETHTERKTCAEEKPMQKRKTMQKENPCRLILRKKFFIGANH